MKLIDLTGKRFGRLTVIKRADYNKNNRIVWICKCDCGEIIDKIGSYLKNGETQSCGCYKKDTELKNLREEYDNKRVNGIVKPLFKEKEPRKDSTTGFRGVSKYYTRKSKEVRYRAWITIKGKRHYKSGFLTPEDAYYKGRLVLESVHLPK